MWYRQIKQAAYSTDLGMLKDVLQYGTDPHDYPYHVGEYLQDQGDEVDGTTDDSHEFGYNWLDSADEGAMQRYKQWLDDNNKATGEDGYSAPPYTTLDYQRMLRPQWLTHFTDSPNEIAQNGFQYGHPDIEGVHLTNHKKKRTEEPGYNFAFQADARDADRAARDGKYGQHGVIFYGGGLQAYHSGDEENQVIFWGPSANKSMAFPIHRDRDGDWSVFDHNDRELVAGKSYPEIVEFIKRNWRMLQQGRDHAEHRRQDRKAR